MIVAVDGPAGSGKSTATRLLAERLGFLWLDTGAMYRAVAWALREAGRPDPTDGEAAALLPGLPLRFSVEGRRLLVRHGDRVLADELRTAEMSEGASRVSRLPAVRAYLTARQRELAAGTDIVAEGRDMGTVVFPEAELKVFLTADAETRAERRCREYREKGTPCDAAAVLRDMRARDEADCSRALAPLAPAPGAVTLDTSGLAIEKVVSRLLSLAASARERRTP